MVCVVVTFGRHSHDSKRALFSLCVILMLLAAKPQVLLIGQYSVGKTSFIRYLLGRDFPGQRIGPEPTTDRFTGEFTNNRHHLLPCCDSGSTLSLHIPGSNLYLYVLIAYHCFAYLLQSLSMDPRNVQFRAMLCRSIPSCHFVGLRYVLVLSDYSCLFLPRFT